MSYILDALKKSERERNLRQTQGAREMDKIAAKSVQRGRTPLRIGLLFTLAGFLVATLLWWALRADPTESRNRAVTAASFDTDMAADVSGGDPNLPQNATVTVDRVLAAKQASIAQSPGGTAPGGQPGAGEAIRSTGQSVPPSYLKTPYLWEMPESLRSGIPDMSVTIHVYSPDVAQQIVFINDRKYHQGEKTKEGVRVEGIVEEGVILSYRQRYFKLPRPR